MDPYTYYKAQPEIPKPPNPWLGRAKHLLPAILITTGSLIIANVVWPIIHYQLFISPGIQHSQLVTPINIAQTVYFTPLTQDLTPQHSTPQIEVQGQDLDYTKASNWFPAANDFEPPSPSKITHYTISIPTIDIKDAVVEIGGEDLSNHLIQYPGTANPGQLGSPVIFGHSVLRQFYNPSPTNKRRYISIFSKIMTLEDGDAIYVDFDGIRYHYVVKQKLEIKPEDVYILGQRYNSRELKLITCVPEGTYLRRGVVVAQLQDVNSPTRGDDLSVSNP